MYCDTLSTHVRPEVCSLGVENAGLGRDVQRNSGGVFLRHADHADISDDHRVRACVLEQLKVGGQRRKIVARWHDIDGNIAFYAVCVRLSDAAAECLVIEVRRCRAHSEALTGHIDCISAVGNAEAHFFGITRR